MKKYLSGFLASALAISMCAFTAPVPLSAADEYDFVSVDDPNDILHGTREEAVAYFGCDVGSKPCAKAYDPATQTRIPSQDLTRM